MNNIPPAATVINSSELPQGYELSNYVIERKLGHGGFGITYLAREIATNRAVVIKENFPRECSQRNTMNLTVGPSSAEDKGLYEWALTRFLDEAKVLIRLSHPGIVPVLTAFKALGTAYYVMPQVEGKDIHKAAPSPQTINEAWLRPVLQKLLEALDYLHGEGLFHRDIKPSNILMGADASPLLIDFGTARPSDTSHTLTRIGSPGFSPKEQFLAHGKNGPWTDLYSLGATCYYLITGEVPQDALERLAEDELLSLASRKELRGRFSAEFLAAIDKALCISHKDRWQCAQEWMNHLSAAQRAREEAERRKKEEARRQAEQRAREEAEEKVRRMVEERSEEKGTIKSITMFEHVEEMFMVIGFFSSVFSGCGIGFYFTGHASGAGIGALLGVFSGLFLMSISKLANIGVIMGVILGGYIGYEERDIFVAAFGGAIGLIGGALLGSGLNSVFGKSKRT